VVADCQSGSLVFRWTADLFCGAGLDAIKGWGRIGRLDPQSLEVGACGQCRARGQRGVKTVIAKLPQSLLTMEHWSSFATDPKDWDSSLRNKV
jgi:hypothetical protein